MAVEVGETAPDFTLPDPAGRDVSLSGFRGRNVVLVFFPGAFSPVCARQLAGIAAAEDRYADSDAQVIGVSVDSRYAQGRFAEDLGLRHTILLADFHPKGEVARRYGVWMEGPGFAGRGTFVIDREGVVRGVHLADNPGLIPDEEAYFGSLAACAVA